MSPARRRERGLDWDAVRALGCALPAVEEGTSYGTPALKVKKKLLVRLKEDGETLVLRTDFFERDALMAMAPDVFFITDHYRDWPSVLVRLPLVDRAQFAELLEDAWRRLAPRALVRARDAGTA